MLLPSRMLHLCYHRLRGAIMKMRELGKLRQIVEEAVGLDVTHIFEDLVFVEMSAFLLRFDDTDFQHFFVYFSHECEREARKYLWAALSQTAKKHGMDCRDEGSFRLQGTEGREEVTITFF